MYRIYSKTKRMLGKEKHGESRVREIRVQGLADEVSQKRRSPLRHSRFSLIELLVVIAIITILAGLLFPALKMAKDVAKEISCMSNLKQMGLTTNMYLDDYNGNYPCSKDSNSVLYQDKLQPYGLNSSVIKCPASNTRSNVKWVATECDYSSNIRIHSNPWGVFSQQRPTSFEPYFNSSRVRSPSSLLIIADATKDTDPRVGWYTASIGFRLVPSEIGPVLTGDSANWTGSVAPRHGYSGGSVLKGRFCFVCADGHVEAMLYGDGSLQDINFCNSLTIP